MTDIKFGDMFAAMIEAIREDLAYFIAFVAVISAVGIAGDLLMPTSLVASSLAGAILTIVGQSYMTRRYLERKGVASAAALADGRFIAIFGISILTGLGIMMGIILLIIPGLILAARWFLSVPAMFAEQSGGTEAIGSSWETTRPYVGSILALIIVIAVPMLIAIIFMFSFSDLEVAKTPLESLIANIGITITTVAGWLGAASTYYLTKGGTTRTSEIFS